MGKERLTAHQGDPYKVTLGIVRRAHRDPCGHVALRAFAKENVGGQGPRLCAGHRPVPLDVAS